MTSTKLNYITQNYNHCTIIPQVFVELDELKYTESGLQWKETARWIKYEEDVDTVDNRWGKPHLAFLNFHALFSLRRGLEAGECCHCPFFMSFISPSK